MNVPKNNNCDGDDDDDDDDSNNNGDANNNYDDDYAIDRELNMSQLVLSCALPFFSILQFLFYAL